MIQKKISNKIKQNKISEIRQDFYKKLFYIGLCIIPIYLFADNKGAYRLVPLPFFLFGMYQFIQIIGLSQLIIDDFFPPKTLYEKTTKPFDKFIYYFSSFLFFSGLIFQIFEIKKLDNTINGITLFWSSSLAGILTAIILTAILKITNPSIYYESKRRYTVYFGLFLGFFLITSATTNFINHHFASTEKTCKNYKIFRKGTSSSRSKEYFIHLNVGNNKQERFSIRKALYDELENGQEIELCSVKGKLGFDFVVEFNKIKD